MNAKDIVTWVEYTQWANAQVMRKLNAVPREDLLKPCWLSGGTLLKTVVHLVDSYLFHRHAKRDTDVRPG